MKITRLQILRMAKENAFDKFVKYSDRYLNSDCTDKQAKELAEYLHEQLEELRSLIEQEEENSLKSL